MRHYQKELSEVGFTIINNIYTPAEVQKIAEVIDAVDSNKPAFRKSKDLFAIRKFLTEVPAAKEHIFNSTLIGTIDEVFGGDYFLVKSIYFDKPEESNWFVSYHQDLTISVDKKVDIDGFGPYTVKPNQFAVQPPLNLLEKNFTIRIHLDDTNEENGALKVIPNSHSKGIYRPEHIDWTVEHEISCNVPSGGIMIMKPLLLHSSSRTTNKNRRRVIHLEFSNQPLPAGLNWAEYLEFN
nr:phytanoyl-CoA dioxygenase family protein [Pedobacter endophyticus]